MMLSLPINRIRSRSDENLSSFSDHLIDIGDRSIDDISLSMFDPLDPSHSSLENFLQPKIMHHGIDVPKLEIADPFDPFSLHELTKPIANSESIPTTSERVKRPGVVKLPSIVKKSLKKCMPPPPPNHTSTSSRELCNEYSKQAVIYPTSDQQTAVPSKQFIVIDETHVDMETSALNNIVGKLKKDMPFNDSYTNLGIAVSPLNIRYPHDVTSIKLIVKTPFRKDPIVFTSDIQAQIGHVCAQILFECGRKENANDHLLKVHGKSEYLTNFNRLGDFEYVQTCIKLAADVKFVMVHAKSIERPFMRTQFDDRMDFKVPPFPLDSSQKSVDSLKVLVDNFHTSVAEFQRNVLNGNFSVTRLIQASRAISILLIGVETTELSKVTLLLEKAPNSDEFRMLQICDQLIEKVHDFLLIYCRSFLPRVSVEISGTKPKDTKPVETVLSGVLVKVATLYKVGSLRQRYDNFKVICGLYFGGERLCEDAVSRQVSPDGVRDVTKIDDWLEFNYDVNLLPLEASLCIALHGLRIQKDKDDDEGMFVDETVAWVNVPIFNQSRNYNCGDHLLPLWMNGKLDCTCELNIYQSDVPLIELSIPGFDYDVFFGEPLRRQEAEIRNFSELHSYDQKCVTDAIEESTCLPGCPVRESASLWQRKYFLTSLPHVLPKLLLCVPSWSFASRGEIYYLLSLWNPLSISEALELLLPRFADENVRSMAVGVFENMATDVLMIYLPQLVQAVKFEHSMTSDLIVFLLRRSRRNIVFAHKLFWLIREALLEPYHRQRYFYVLHSLRAVIGEKMCSEVRKQEELVDLLGVAADNLRKAKDKDTALKCELEPVYTMLSQESQRLPINPSLEINGLDLQTSSYYASKTFPLKLVFKNPDSTAELIYTMFKSGDDLRQDMLVLQLVHIMDSLWLGENIDLKMLTFNCVQTDRNKGMVEVITSAETLRKIQMNFGLTGAFKDRPIAEWLKKRNPTELDYQQAVRNFIRSCAGCCVATYILGIGDRHNDNIMLRETGHMFHIDFGKFMGDKERFGNISRDRVPFILTPDMAYVINGGEHSSASFQQFIDLCCDSFCVIRKHGKLFINLLALMRYSGIPRLTEDAFRFVYNALMPHLDDNLARSEFKKMIVTSLSSLSTQLNFFVHAIAQLKHYKHTEGELLSFVSKTFTWKQDGLITRVEVADYQKRYSPNKHYMYLLMVYREDQKMPARIFRKYSEFEEFYRQLIILFPNAAHDVPAVTSIVIGRSEIRSVADQRKVSLQTFVDAVLSMAGEVSQCDLVYTFFHPIQRDQEDDKAEEQLHSRRFSIDGAPTAAVISGQVQLTIHYKNRALHVFVRHARDLKPFTDKPDAYVKVYLLPDPTKMTKRKTKIVRNNCNPSFMEQGSRAMMSHDIDRIRNEWNGS